MATTLNRWGQSIGLRIPRAVAECAALKVGDSVHVRLLDSGDLLVRAARPRESPVGYVPGNAPAKGESTKAEEKW